MLRALPSPPTVSRHYPMITQQRQLEEALNRDGWVVVSRDTDLDWWADEMWLIESERSPYGFQLCLTFLVDPMREGPRRKGEGVWAIGTAEERPGKRGDAEDKPLVTIGRGWETRLPGFITGLAAKRAAQERASRDTGK